MILNSQDFKFENNQEEKKTFANEAFLPRISVLCCVAHWGKKTMKLFWHFFVFCVGCNNGGGFIQIIAHSNFMLFEIKFLNVFLKYRKSWHSYTLMIPSFLLILVNLKMEAVRGQSYKRMRAGVRGKATC